MGEVRLVFNYGGTLSQDTPRVYINGRQNEFRVDPDYLIVPTIYRTIVSFGCACSGQVYRKKEELSMDDHLVKVSNDSNISQIYDYISAGGMMIELYVDHCVDPAFHLQVSGYHEAGSDGELEIIGDVNTNGLGSNVEDDDMVNGGVNVGTNNADKMVDREVLVDVNVVADNGGIKVVANKGGINGDTNAADVMVDGEGVEEGCCVEGVEEDEDNSD